MDPDQTLKGTDSIWSKVLLTLVQPLWGRRNLIAAGFFSHFSGMRIVLLVMVSMGLIVLSVSVTSTGAAEIIVRRWRFWLPWFAAGLILLGVLWNEFFIARYLSLDGTLEASTISTIRWEQAIAVLIGITLLMLRAKVTVVVERLVHRMATTALVGAQTTQPPDGRLLALSLIIPWLILVSIVEINRVIRFWWLWPLQVVVLAASVTHIPSRLQMPRLVTWIGSLSLIFMLVVTPSTVLRIEAGLRTGWAGSDSEEVQVIDYVASRLEARRQAAIGYQLFIPRFYATFSAADPRYRTGADFDLLFKARHGVLNTNRCAEGVSPDDEFRIVQTRPTGTDRAAIGYVNIPLDKNFRLLRQFGLYQVFQRS